MPTQPGGIFGTFLVFLLASVFGTLPTDAPARESESKDKPICERAGTWLDPETGKALPADALMASLARRDIVLLGESHTAAEHHRWELQMLAGLHAYRSAMVVGFEMFPRSVQPALDAWSHGDSSVTEFLKAARWNEVWGYAPWFYLPLFQFVRQNRLPMVALNVDRGLVSDVGQKGWQAVPKDQKEGLSDPAPASDAYRKRLAAVWQMKQARKEGESTPGEGDDPHPTTEKAIDPPPEISEIPKSEEFGHFVEAQLTWDRAMAEALAGARKANPNALVVGIMGRGHIEYRHGVPHQLADLGEKNVAVLIPTETGGACDSVEPGVADAVFLVDPVKVETPHEAKPRLGIMIKGTRDGVRVEQVMEGSVAKDAGIANGDIIRTAATFPIEKVSELIEIVQRQAPGTWLPLDIVRDGKKIRIVAKFPTKFE